jgi:hypothetical protein
LKEIDDEQRLLHETKKMLVRDQVYGILHEAHIRLGHAGRDLMDKDLSGYHGLSKQANLY